MRQRSKDLLADAARFLYAARVLLDAEIPENSASEAYYAMHFAARATLSEEDRDAKTHRGTWSQFDELFVQTGRFDKRLRDAARNAEELRLDSDYRLGGASRDEAAEVLASAREFVASVKDRFAAS